MSLPLGVNASMLGGATPCGPGHEKFASAARSIVRMEHDGAVAIAKVRKLAPSSTSTVSTTGHSSVTLAKSTGSSLPSERRCAGNEVSVNSVPG